MIPKTIHYIWLGGAEMPPEIKACIDTWRNVLADYNLRLWTEADIDEIDSDFVREALAARKWAFASDVIRLYALYTYGGIYLDTDVKVFKTFDPLLSERAFTGRESSMHILGSRTVNYVTTCCVGSEAGNPFIQRCLDYYSGRHFVTCADALMPPELRLDMRLNSEVMCILAEQIGYQASVLRNDTQRLGEITIYPSTFFDPAGRRPESYSQHMAFGTWREGPRKVWTYTLRDKISWRIWAVAEWLVRKFNRTIIRLH